jgi:hypothetical protein
VIGAKRLEDVVAHSALKRMQAGTEECRHDAGEHHPGLALRTGRTLNRSERNDGRQGSRFCHDASFERARVQHLCVPVMSAGSNRGKNYISQVAGSLFNSAQFPKRASVFSSLPLLVTRSASLSPSIADSAADLQKMDRAAFAGGPSQGGNALGEGSDSGGYRSPLIFQMEKPRALMDLNFDRAGD